MTVRNFYIKGTVDGRKTPIEGGPRSKDGGFSITVTVREDGGVRKALTITGEALPNGELRLWAELAPDLTWEDVYNPDGPKALKVNSLGAIRATTKRG